MLADVAVAAVLYVLLSVVVFNTLCALLSVVVCGVLSATVVSGLLSGILAPSEYVSACVHATDKSNYAATAVIPPNTVRTVFLLIYSPFFVIYFRLL